MKLTTSFLFLIIIFKMFSCSGNEFNIAGGSKEMKEIKRVSSPDKKVEAVLVETNGGATVANGNSIFLVLPGRKVTSIDTQYSLFNADHTYKIDLHWLQDKRLLITYDKARIFHFTNFWHSGSLDNWNYIVELSLKSNQPNNQLN